MSQFPKRGLDLVLRQAHHRCASHPAQGIRGERGLLLRQACASAGALGGGAAAWTDLESRPVASTVAPLGPSAGSPRRNTCAINNVDLFVERPKKIGFLSFGAWHPGGGLTHTGGEALRQTVELAVAAEELGVDGAFVRVHHFARQLSSPFPLL